MLKTYPLRRFKTKKVRKLKVRTAYVELNPLTCSLDETNTLLDKKWDRSVRRHHTGKRDPKVAAFWGLGNRWTGLWSCFLKVTQ